MKFFHKEHKDGFVCFVLYFLSELCPQDPTDG